MRSFISSSPLPTAVFRPAGNWPRPKHGYPHATTPRQIPNDDSYILASLLAYYTYSVASRRTTSDERTPRMRGSLSFPIRVVWGVFCPKSLKAMDSIRRRAALAKLLAERAFLFENSQSLAVKLPHLQISEKFWLFLVRKQGGSEIMLPSKRLDFHSCI